MILLFWAWLVKLIEWFLDGSKEFVLRYIVDERRANTAYEWNKSAVGNDSLTIFRDNWGIFKWENINSIEGVCPLMNSTLVIKLD